MMKYEDCNVPACEAFTDKLLAVLWPVLVSVLLLFVAVKAVSFA